MAIPTDNFALKVPTTTLGEYPNNPFYSVSSTNINTITAGTINAFNVNIPTTTLGFNPNNPFYSISSSDIKNITNGSIPSINVLIPTTTLGFNPNNPFTSVENNKVVFIDSAGYLPNWGARVPSIPLGGQFSTFIYTANAPITSIDGGSSTSSTQTWYMS